ncbi:MAG TPA: hypothetical protein P5287_02675, partial [bacterium]|nr:hypothetical protein [bacterium]
MKTNLFVKLVCLVTTVAFLSTQGAAYAGAPARLQEAAANASALAPEQIVKKEPKKLLSMMEQQEELNAIFQSAFDTVTKELADGKKSLDDINKTIRDDIAAKVKRYHDEETAKGRKIGYELLPNYINAGISTKNGKRKLDYLLVMFKMRDQYFHFVVKAKDAPVDAGAQAILDKLPLVRDFSVPDKNFTAEIRKVPLTDEMQKFIYSERQKMLDDPAIPADVKDNKSAILSHLMPMIFSLLLILNLLGCGGSGGGGGIQQWNPTGPQVEVPVKIPDTVIEAPAGSQLRYPAGMAQVWTDRTRSGSNASPQVAGGGISLAGFVEGAADKDAIVVYHELPAVEASLSEIVLTEWEGTLSPGQKVYVNFVNTNNAGIGDPIDITAMQGKVVLIKFGTPKANVAKIEFIIKGARGNVTISKLEGYGNEVTVTTTAPVTPVAPAIEAPFIQLAPGEVVPLPLNNGTVRLYATPGSRSNGTLKEI